MPERHSPVYGFGVHPVLFTFGGISAYSFGLLALIGYGAGLGVFLYFLLGRPQPMNVWRLLDLFAVAGVTALSLQRLGCFLAGSREG